jgi:hypothetical protein
MLINSMIPIMENWSTQDYIGDTVSLQPNYWLDGFVYPLLVSWTPSTNLLYDDSLFPITSTPGSYMCVIIDAFGCEYTSYCDVFVDQVGVDEQSQNKTLLKVTDVLGRKSKGTKNTPLFYIYDDGTVEKKIIIE